MCFTIYERYQQQNVKPALPIELHLDVPKQKLPELFDKCTYSFLPAYRGATLRNSSISSSLANKFITYSHINDQITPTNLKPGGKYSTSMVLQSNDDYNKYAENVFINISGREHNPKLNKRTWTEMERVNSNELDPAKIATQYVTVYSIVN